MIRRKPQPLMTTKELSQAGVTRIVMPRGSLDAPAGYEATPHELVAALEEMNRHLEELETIAADGGIVSRVDAVNARQGIVNALLARYKDEKLSDGAGVILLADVLRYRRGLGRYNLSRLPDDQRSIAALEAWEELETRIENALLRAGVKVS